MAHTTTKFAALDEGLQEEVRGSLSETHIMAGQLSKLSTKGKWKVRYWSLLPPFLLNWDSMPPAGKPVDPKEVIDLRAVTSVVLGTEVLLVSLKDRSEYRLKLVRKSDDAALLEQWKTSLCLVAFGVKDRRVLSPRSSRKSLRLSYQVGEKTELENEVTFNDQVREVLSNDEVLFSGVLEKSTSQEEADETWEPRFWQIRSPFVLFWEDEEALTREDKETKKPITTWPLGIVDLRCMSEISINDNNELELESENGQLLTLRDVEGSSTIKDWQISLSKAVSSVLFLQ